MLGPDKQFDASCDARLAADKAGPFESQDHLVDGRRGDAEMLLDIGFGRRAAKDAAIGVDEGQVLTLLLGEGWSRRSVCIR